MTPPDSETLSRKKRRVWMEERISSGIPSLNNGHIEYDCSEGWAEAYVCVCVSVHTRWNYIGGVLGDGVWGDQAFGEV